VKLKDDVKNGDLSCLLMTLGEARGKLDQGYHLLIAYGDFVAVSS